MPSRRKAVALPERAPPGLRAAGKRLWRDIHHALPDDGELDERELAILAAACRQADDVAALEEAIAADGVMVAGAQGQTRLNAAVTECRQARLAVARLLGELDLSDPDAEPRTARSRRARRAADARWDARDQLTERRARASAS
jgi:P27 family predicted phage terminase small subunit